MGMRLFARITKVDEAKREVYGRAAQEVPDASNEIFDYETSKPLFQAWSRGFEEATDGKSLGNVRAMHQAIAAGKVTAIDFNDDDKAVDIRTKIVDDSEWNKVLEGIYTGFSIGGRYAKKWTDGMLTRYTAQPSEVSLVDKPCIPTAMFYDVVKMDGSIVKAQFKEKTLPPLTAEAAVDEIASLFNNGVITPQKLLELGKADLAKAKNSDVPKRPESISEEKWSSMSDEDQLAAVKAKKDDDGDDGDMSAADKAAPAGDAAKDAAKPADGTDAVAKVDPAQAVAANTDAATAAAAVAAAQQQPDPNDKAAVAAHNAEVEKIARELAVTAFEKLEPAAKAGAQPDRDWPNFVAEATRELGKRKVSQAERGKEADDGAAMPDGSYPIKTVADLENAIQAFGRAKDADKVKAHIIARAKALKATDKLPADWTGSTKAKDSKKADDAGALRKGLYNVQSFASALQSLACIFFSAQSEFDYEGDGSPVPAKLRSWIGNGAQIFKEMATEEVDELVESLSTVGNKAVFAYAERIEMHKQLGDPALGGDELDAILSKALTPDEMKAITGDALAKGNGKLLTSLREAALAKYGARHSAEDLARLQKAHDAISELGAKCDKADAAPMNPDNGNAASGNSVTHTEKGDAGTLLKLKTAEDKIDGLEKTVGTLHTTITQQTEEIRKLRDEPARPRGVLRMFGKGEDVATTAVEKKDDAAAPKDPAQDFTPGKHEPEKALAKIKDSVTATAAFRKF